MRLSLGHFIRDQYGPVPPLVSVNLSGKTVMVVGANTGVGFEATKHFAGMNPGRLIMACRNPAKGEAAVERLKRETGFKRVELWIIDLAVFASVLDFARKFEEDGGRLDIVVQNAGVLNFDHIETVDGWENSIQVNNLSLPLLAFLLLPRMVQTGKEHGTTPRLVMVSSEVHYWGDIEKDALESGDILGTLSSKAYCTTRIMNRRYFDSKLINILFLRAFNDRFPKTPGTMIATSVTPGYSFSELRRNYKGIRAFADWIAERLLATTAEVGSRQLIYASVGGTDIEDELRGAYITRSKVREVSDFAFTKEGKKAQEDLWNETIKILVGVDPKVQQILDTYFVPKTGA
ncbi:short-chain dehydrogenase [Collybia nuda]|uniref:Short-chain dehydrogenase n=1 Tax=Collybia nuda TaxID=64659 RepID=A0A9P6CFT9_9AGAR|nr:short-chain dehydrogenase [Collybia nuda]